MTRSINNPMLHRFAVCTALATLALIVIGGLVTSKGAGMAVPDWPTSYGYNMFALPFKFWKGGVFYEHTHRLWASGVGFLTTLLAVWLWMKESRSWLRWLGVVAFFAVALQGVLGGLRVVLFKDQIGIFHATLAQLFFVLTCAIALFTSKWWQTAVAAVYGSTSEINPEVTDRRYSDKNLRWLFIATTALILFQLILGATMRHQHAGLAISDFPLAYGKIWPAMDADSVARYNQQRMEVTSENPITAFQIGLQMAHRISAVLILAAVALCAWSVRSSAFRRSEPAEAGTPNMVCRLSFTWLGLILIQVILGAATVLTHKAADMATAHVLVGALSLAIGSLLCIISFCVRESGQGASARSRDVVSAEFVSNATTAQP
jgi:cytochrome c oxidase assembly protein subunit 15